MQYQKLEEMIENAYEDKLSGSITESYYNKTRDKLREKQKKLQQQMGKLQIADEEYYITSDYILDLAKRAPELYESSEPIEKRQLLKFALQNLQLDGSLACYDEIKPFDTIRLYASRQAWLPEPHLTIIIDFITVIQAFQDLRYIGELRQRWLEIKRLQVKNPLSTHP